MVLLAGIGGCVRQSPDDSSRPSASISSSILLDPGNGTENTSAPHLLNLTWYLDSAGRMGSDLPAVGKVPLGGTSDPTHSRDLIQFVAEPYRASQQLVQVAVHLIFESAAPWFQTNDQIQCWFGFEDISFPAQGDDLALHREDANKRFDVRFNLTLPPGGAYIPKGAKPYFLCGVPGSQNPGEPLHLLIGGDRASHIHPRSYNWTDSPLKATKVHEEGGQLIPDQAPAGPTSSPPYRLSLPADSAGFRASVRTNSSQGMDFDVQVKDATGKQLAESNGPRAAEELRFAAFNLAAAPGDYLIQVVNAGSAAGTYWLVVESYAASGKAPT